MSNKQLYFVQFNKHLRSTCIRNIWCENSTCEFKMAKHLNVCTLCLSPIPTCSSSYIIRLLASYIYSCGIDEKRTDLCAPTNIHSLQQFQQRPLNEPPLQYLKVWCKNSTPAKLLNRPTFCIPLQIYPLSLNFRGPSTSPPNGVPPFFL
jgi:hypothetical protein